MNSKQRGMISETRFLFRCTELGILISQPFGDNAPYDFIIDIDGVLKKVQCKTLQLTPSNAYHIDASSTNYYNGVNKRTLYTGIDFFYGYHPEDGVEMLVKGCDCEKSFIARVAPPKNNVKNVKWVKDFSIEQTLGLSPN